MREDKQGNRLYIHDDGMYLKLIKESIPRKIFNFSGGKIVKFVRKSNIMNRPYKSIGFNYYALLEITNNGIFKDKNIYVKIGKKYHKIPAVTIVNKKEFFHFKKKGFELQCFYSFMTIKELEVDATLNYTKNKKEENQTCLFN